MSSVKKRQRNKKIKAAQHKKLLDEQKRQKTVDSINSMQLFSNKSINKTLICKPKKKRPIVEKKYPSVSVMARGNIVLRAKQLTDEMQARENKAQSEIERKRKCLAPAYNKGAYQPVFSKEDAKHIGR